MKKNHDWSKFLFLGLIVLGLGACNKQPVLENNQLVAENPNKFTSSKVLDFSVDLPEGYNTQELGTTVRFTNKNLFINLTRSGTNFNSLSGYLEGLDQMNNTAHLPGEKLEGFNESVTRTTNFENNRSLREYIHFVDGLIYTFSTWDTEAYDDLDFIARSFQYTGETN